MEDLAVLVAIVSLLIFAGWLAYEASYHACASRASRLAEMQAEAYFEGYSQGHSDGRWEMQVQGAVEEVKAVTVLKEEHRKAVLKNRRFYDKGLARAYSEGMEVGGKKAEKAARSSSYLDLRQKLRLHRKAEELQERLGQVKLELMQSRRASMPNYHEKVEDLLWMFDEVA